MCFCAVLSGCRCLLYVDYYERIALWWGYGCDKVGHPPGLHHTKRQHARGLHPFYFIATIRVRSIGSLWTTDLHFDEMQHPQGYEREGYEFCGSPELIAEAECLVVFVRGMVEGELFSAMTTWCASPPSPSMRMLPLLPPLLLLPPYLINHLQSTILSGLDPSFWTTAGTPPTAGWWCQNYGHGDSRSKDCFGSENMGNGGAKWQAADVMRERHLRLIFSKPDI